MDLVSIAKYLIYFGLILLVTGGFIYFLGKAGIGLGRLPGDILIQKGNFTFYFPLITSVIISIILTVILNLVFRK